MNKVYQVVWNSSTGSWVVTSEMAKGRKKKASRRDVLAMALTSTVLGASSVAVSTPATAGQLCITGARGASPVSVSSQNSTNVMKGCGPNFAPGSSDVAALEAGGSAMWVDGTTGYLNFRAGGSNGYMMQYRPNGTLGGISNGVNSTDAVNVSQLNAVSGSIGNISTSVTNLTNNITYGKIGLVQQASSGANLTVGASTNGAAIDFKGTAGNRKLINAAAGAVNGTSTDAINGSQLYGVANSTAGAIGGGSTANADGTIKAPSITIGGTTYNDVSSAIKAAAGSGGDALNWNATTGAYDAKHGSSAVGPRRGQCVAVEGRDDRSGRWLGNERRRLHQGPDVHRGWHHLQQRR